ncbi:MAG: phosphatase PAP2 family protein [bacterium]|nr:phosphatase PAP2 family protein [bacterium]
MKYLLSLTVVLGVCVGQLSPASVTKPFKLCLDSPIRLLTPLNTQAAADFPAIQPLKMFTRSHRNHKTGGEGLDLNKEYWKEFVSNIKHTVSAPFHWGKNDWLKAAAVTGITAGLYLKDQEIMSWVQKHYSKTTRRIADFAENFGNYQFVFPALALTYGYGAVANDPKLKDTALLAAESIVISELLVFSLKFITHRRRPAKGNYNEWKGPGFSLSNLSFPSGHSAMAFSLAVVISSQYKSPLVGVLVYGTAALTAFSRVHDKRHWASDVFLGSAIGYFVTRWIVKRRKKKEQNPEENAALAARSRLIMNVFAAKNSRRRIRVFPMIGFNSLGLSLNVQF